MNRKFLKEISESCLRIASEGVKKNTCDIVSNEIAYTLEKDCNIESFSPMKAPVNGAKHFVCLVPSNECSFVDSNEGYVVVDATLEQFSDSIDEDIKEIEILPPSSDKREKFYDRIQKPD